MVSVAVLGATGMVGREMLDILLERSFPFDNLKLLASERSVGKKISCRGRDFLVEKATPESFEGVDIVLASAGAKISQELAPHAVKAGAVVIDNTSAFRMDPDVPLVVSEVNPEALKSHRGIIANPNCSTAQLVLVLHPLRELGRIERVTVATYQSVSGAGKDAVDELMEQSAAYLRGEKTPPYHLSKPIAFNLIPQIDLFLENGYTKEEMKMTNETKKILGDQSLRLSATAVRVPVPVGHSEAVQIEFDREVGVEEVKKILARAHGVKLMDDPATLTFPQPSDVAGKDEVLVGRIRADVSHPHGLALWVVGDNLRKGAALNAVQIAEVLLEKGWLKIKEQQ
ncbi:MAG TPA: aspartate-semialdehyde dehydrogenase [Cyanobacteria bacterium UBA8530]|nr:aspartate-semialdehyde dehydrogenase [Cyanobacteria bacterium UBA8530]